MELDGRGFSRALGHLRDMAEQLLAVRGGGQVGEKWATNLTRRKPELKSQLARQRNCQRVVCSDPAVMKP